MPRHFTEIDLLRIKEAHESDLMAIENVVGVGIGPCSIGGLCIKVYVTELTSEVKASVPANLDGAMVEIEVTGSISI